MKNSMIILISIVLIASPLVSFRTMIKPPPPFQILHGNLRWAESYVCGSHDYINHKIMGKVYLTGKGFPSEGQFLGCIIDAHGWYYTNNGCNLFEITDYKLVCGDH